MKKNISLAAALVQYAASGIPILKSAFVKYAEKNSGTLLQGRGKDFYLYVHVAVPV